MSTVIKSDRPAAQAYLNRPAKFLREVAEGDPAFNGNAPQVVVLIDGKEIYFFADEVIRDDAEKPKLVAVPPAGAIGGAVVPPKPEPTPSA